MPDRLLHSLPAIPENHELKMGAPAPIPGVTAPTPVAFDQGWFSLAMIWSSLSVIAFSRMP